MGVSKLTSTQLRVVTRRQSLTSAATMPPKKKKKAAKKSNSCIFDNFTQKVVAEFKEGFRVIDKDKDGFIGKEDLKATFAELGRPGTDEEFEAMIAECPSAIPGKIDPDHFRSMLMQFGNKFTNEVDEVYTI